MFAIVQLGALQYKISEGDVIESQLLEGEKGKSLTLDQVLLFVNDTDVRIGRPFLKDVTVTAEIKRQHLGEKVVSYKYRRRKTSAWKKGHRQKLTALAIKKIDAANART